MKKGLLLLCYCFLTFAAAAQQDTTTVYVRPGIERDPIRANLKKVVTKKENLWIVSLYTKRNLLFEQISFADEKLEVRQGPYARYENAVMVEKGQYNRGYRVGTWMTYHLNGNMRSGMNYVWDKLNGRYTKFWDNNQLYESATFLNGNYVGERNIFYKNGKLALKELYDEKGKISGSYFNAQGNEVSREEVMKGLDAS